jgi:ribosomal-protein-alanine N-acetyltransferase
LVAEEEGKVLGYCGTVMVLNECDITNVAVTSSCQGRGIGRQMMEAMIEQTKERGIDTLHLEVRKSNEPAISLYKSLGFKQTGIRKGYYEAPVEDGIVMSLLTAS